jgi:hypothetical protein
MWRSHRFITKASAIEGSAGVDNKPNQISKLSGLLYIRTGVNVRCMP